MKILIYILVSYWVIALLEFIWVWTSAKRIQDEITVDDLLTFLAGSLTVVVIPVLILYCYFERLSKKVIWRRK